jgi:drug/metabolite transporter (DMT)-like permease
MAHLFLLLAVVSFGMLGVMHKVADHRGCRPEGANLVLFFGAAFLILSACVWQNGFAKALDVPPAGWIVATGCGFLSSMAILNFQHGVRFGKISTSWLVINLSTALPTVLSILIYHEAVSTRRALGLALAVAALLILWLERIREEKAAAIGQTAGAI